MMLRSFFLQRDRLACLVLGSFFAIACIASADAQTVIDRLSGFDEARIAAVAQYADVPDDESFRREAAKLIYQVNRLARSGTIGAAPEALDSPPDGFKVGNPLSIRGTVVSIARGVLPADLREVLEFAEVYRVEVAAERPPTGDSPSEGEATKVIVLTSVIPSAWLKPGAEARVQETSTTGVLVRPESNGKVAVIAAPSLTWLASSANDKAASNLDNASETLHPDSSKSDSPADAFPEDWTMLGALGFDLSLLEGVRSRDRQPLRAADSAAFYPLLRIAASLAQENAGEWEALAPRRLPPADLLKRSTEMVGRFVQMDLQTVRFTRIMVTESFAQQQLGSDHYWQIDALGDLGNVVIRIESGGDEAAIFANRYPVSIAVRELPAFLVKAIQRTTSDEVDVADFAMLSTQVRIDGIFLRLWSYDSDFMTQHGGGKQFGPLLIASRMIDIEPTRGDAVAVSRIGWYVAAFALLTIAIATVGGVITSRRDAAAKRRSRAARPDRIGL